MKKLLLPFIILLTFMPISKTLASDSGSIEINEDNVAKKWIFKDVINTKLSKKELEENKSLLEGFSLILNKDKSCITSFIMDLEGTWKLDAANKKIITQDRKGTNVWIIHSVSATELTLSRNDSEQEIVFTVDKS